MTSISYNIEAADFDAIAEWADSVGGEFGVSSEGRLLVSGVNAAELVEAQPFERFYLALVDETTVAFQF
jgi:hypothetical protein